MNIVVQGSSFFHSSGHHKSESKISDKFELRRMSHGLGALKIGRMDWVGLGLEISGQWTGLCSENLYYKNLRPKYPFRIIFFLMENGPPL